MRNHVALSPASKAHSISVLALISLAGDEPCPLVLRYGFLHHLRITLCFNNTKKEIILCELLFDSMVKTFYNEGNGFCRNPQIYASLPVD